MYASLDTRVVYSFFTQQPLVELCNYHHNPMKQNSYHPKRSLCPFMVYSHSLPLPSPLKSLIYLLSIDVLFLDISHKWNQAIYGLLCLTTFTYHNAFEVSFAHVKISGYLFNLQVPLPFLSFSTSYLLRKLGSLTYSFPTSGFC